MKATDEEIKQLLKDMEKMGIKSYLATGKETEMSDKERDEGR